MRIKILWNSVYCIALGNGNKHHFSCHEEKISFPVTLFIFLKTYFIFFVYSLRRSTCTETHAHAVSRDRIVYDDVIFLILFRDTFFCRSTSYMAHGAPFVLMHMYSVICTHSYVIHPFRISHSKYTEHKCEFEVLGHGRGSASVFIRSNIHLFWCWIWSRNPDIYM